jgi:hypothetical protein
MSEYQDEVLTNLLDLQAELRGDEGEQHGGEERASEMVTVAEPGMAVSMPSPQRQTMTVHERLTALNERLSRLELELAGITKRVERIEPHEPAEQPLDPNTDPEAPWRSFLDLQRIVAERLDR